MAKKAVIYCRISRDRTGAEAGVTRQEKECRDLVERNGWELVALMSDNDISAYSGKRRPGWQQAMELVTVGAVDVLVAWHPDRLTRSPAELEALIDILEEAEVQVETCRAGRWDLSTRSGRTQARLIGVIARDESEAKSERLKAMTEAKAKAGQWHGGRRHYGYRSTGDGGLEVVPEEAEIIRETARRVLTGEAVNRIVNDLNRRDVKTVTGKMWRTQTMRRTVTSWTVTGVLEFREEPIGPASWEPILDRATRDRLHRILYDPTRTRTVPPTVAFLTGGLIRCGECGAKMGTARRSKKANPQGQGVRLYRCQTKALGGCGGVQIRAHLVEDLVRDSILVAVDEHALGDAVRDQGQAVARPAAEDLATIEDELAALAADFGARRISRREWMAARAPLETARDEAEARLTTRDARAALAEHRRHGPIAEQWPDFTVDQRRALVATVIDKVVVRSANGRRGPTFDQDRITIEWAA